MPIDERSISLPEQWAKDAQTVIPAPPVPGIAYRNTAVTPEQWAHGQDYSRVADSAQWNQMFWVMSGLLQSAEQYGVMPYSPFTDYPELGICMGADGQLYQALQPSGPNNGGAQPTNNDEFWKHAVAIPSLDKYDIGEFYYFRHPTLKPGFAPLQGGLISGVYQGKNITEWPIWEYLQTTEGQKLCKTEAEWQAMSTAIWHTNADGSTVGWNGIGGVPYYAPNLGAGSLRMPDVRGMYPEAAGFDSLGVGGVHIDMIRNFASSLELSDRIYAATGITTATGALYMSNIRSSRSFSRDVSTSYDGGDLSIDPSRKVPVGAANKPRAWGALACCYLGAPAS